jgi:hypothetical protein
MAVDGQWGPRGAAYTRRGRAVDSEHESTTEDAREPYTRALGRRHVFRAADTRARHPGRPDCFQFDLLMFDRFNFSIFE